MNVHRWLRPCLAGGALLSVGIGISVVFAADHDEAGTTSFTDNAADIGDLYAFHDGDKLTLIMTYAGYKIPVNGPEYDADVLYSFHIDTNGDQQADETVHARFGQDADGNWGIQLKGIPGVDGAVSGAIEEVIEDTDSGAMVFGGFRDDPFFFDLSGFTDTLETGTVAFDPTRDFAASLNTGAIAVQFDHAALGSTAIDVWATSGRLGS